MLPGFHVSYQSVSDPWYYLEDKKKDKYTTEELRSMMETIKTTLIILCRSRGL